MPHNRVMLQYTDRVLMAERETWHEDMDIGSRTVLIDSRTWTPNVTFPTTAEHPVIAFKSMDQFNADLEKYGRKSPSGRWVYANVAQPEAFVPHTITSWVPGSRVPEEQEGVYLFDNAVVFPVLYGEKMDAETIKRKKFNCPMPPGTREVWMSYTPMETYTQKPQLDAAKGRVVIGGLGLGWFASRVAAKHNVTEVVIVEKAYELIEWYGNSLREKLFEQHRNVKVSIVHADVYEYMAMEHALRSRFPRMRDTVYLLDIWPQYRDACHDRKLLMFVQAGLDIHAWGLPDALKHNPKVWERMANDHDMHKMDE